MSEDSDSIYLKARDIADPTERAEFLEDACANLPALRQQIERMLADEGRAEAFFREDDTGTPSPDRTERIPVPLAPPAPPIPPGLEGRTIGRYKVLEKIGEGGFGSVWMAEQTEPVRRKVALKIIKRGMDTLQVIARFEAERQALAMMDHPNIAKVLDAGTTDTGRPYFVMELVKGIPVTEFCNRWKLNTDQRLQLFAEICSAINHAHQKGIIHRDIKPSNVLVTLHGDRPVPMVIDFGIAKATEAKLTDKTVFTRKGELIGTPAYMSPEQVGLSGLDIDTRSDIYSLGVLLYELLAGQPPFEPQKLISAGFDEMRRIIREVDPPRPSLKLNAAARDESERIQEQLGATPQKLGRLLKGELDWIVMKALEKDRTRRYESANALADDVKRYLANELVQARPPSKLYEFQKSVRRHKFGFAATAAIIVALAVEGTVAMWWQGAEARKARHEVETAKSHAQMQRIAAEQARATLLAMGARGATNFAAIPPKPADPEFLLDLAGVISDADARMITNLQQEILRQSGVPIEAVTIRYLHDYDPASPGIEDFARRWFQAWDIAGGERDDGMLIVVSTGDRKAYIELGPKWESRFDGLRRRLITREMVPRFKGGDYGKGLIAAINTLAVIAKAGPQSTPPVPSLADRILNNPAMVFIRQNNPIAKVGGPFVTLLMVVIGLGSVIASVRLPQSRRRLLIAGTVMVALALVFWIGVLAIAVLLLSRWRGLRGGGRLGGGFGIHRVTGKLRGMGGMNHADRLFSSGDCERISQRITKLERRTDAEVVCAVATESGRYDRAESLCGLAVGLGALILCTKLAGMNGWDSSTTLSLGLQIALVAGGFLLGSVLASYCHGLRSLLVSSREMKSEVSRTAHQVFTQHGVGGTPNRGGVLIYLSLFERLLEVRCDQQVAEKITRSDLVVIRDAVLDKVRNGDTAGGLLAGLDRAEEILTHVLPATDATPAPLPDEVLLFHPRP